MHTFNCTCGHSIAIIPPSEHAGYVVLDSDADLHIDNRTVTIRAFLDAVRTGRRSEWLTEFYGPNVPQPRFAQKDDADVIEDILSNSDSWTRFLYRCPMCGRIHIETSPRSRSFKTYAEN
ncbi:hypothetical protein MFFC18_47670 [Mariniblastus fucicola]|uniref:Uncharacterized protein n=1 Tax=Mariniblastus fucicola TaxID=980251 RepID=A0A5B9PF06_9BACT|nr:hypothetical protein MFFC18_47670 [Mariniblastus fucicola]